MGVCASVDRGADAAADIAVAGADIADTAEDLAVTVGQMHVTMADNFQAFGEDFDQLNDTVGRVAEDFDRNMGETNEQLEIANINIEAGLNRFNNNVEAAIEDLDRNMGDLNEQLGNANENMEAGINQGIRAFEVQANDLNRTAEATAQDIRRAADAFEGTAGMIDNALEEWSPSIAFILSFIGPLQVLTGVNHFSQIIRNLGVIGPIPQSIQELKETNVILKNIADGQHQKQMKNFVCELTRSSVGLHTDRAGGKLATYFFYTRNNFLVRQLIGPDGNNPKYFAFDSIRRLLSSVSCWNKYLDFLENRNENFARLGSRRTIVYFLDPPETKIVLPKVEFLEVYKDINFINHFRSTSSVKLKSIKVHPGCSVRLENVTVCEIDEACEGKVDLYKCTLGWDPNKRVIDRVTCDECEKMKTSWKRNLKIVGIVTVLVIVVLWLLWGNGVIFKSESVQIAMNYCEKMCKSLQERYNETVRVGGTELRAEVLKYLSNSSLSVYGPIINCWDVSTVSDMSEVFSIDFSLNETEQSLLRAFNEPLDCWDTSGVGTMENMFRWAEAFDYPIGNWDVSNVVYMNRMFDGAKAFNQYLDSWKVGKVEDMTAMFRSAQNFDQPVNNWDVSSVKSMEMMFYGASVFNQELDGWDVSSVTSMQQMFEDARLFNRAIGDWNIFSLGNTDRMFAGAKYFNQNLCKWKEKSDSLNDTDSMFDGTNCPSRSSGTIKIVVREPSG
eukprot:scaffold1680_cov79-Cylindrotheca_fusiformis.AAC.2